jgi:fimbrial chaperone protein
MKRRWPAAAGMLLLAASGLVCAGGFSLSPVGLSIPKGDASGSIVAENTSGAPLVVQVRTQAWRQAGGKDIRDDTRDLIVNPPIFKLAPGEQQLVRIASRDGPPPDVERAYRVVFSEVAPKDAPTGPAGFRFTLAMDIPVYIEPAVPAVPAMRWQAERTATGLRLIAENAGAAHYRIVEAVVAVAGKVLAKPGAIVVLPKSTMVYDLPAVPPGTVALHLAAEDGASHPVSVDIPLPRAP